MTPQFDAWVRCSQGLTTQLASALLVSQRVAGLASLIASAWRVHQSAAPTGTTTSVISTGSRRFLIHSPQGLPRSPSGVNSTSRTGQNNAVVGFTSHAAVPAARAAAARAGWRVSRQLIPAHRNPTQAAVTRNSIMAARLHSMANGMNRKKANVHRAAVRPASWRTRPYSSRAVSRKNPRLVTLQAMSEGMPNAIGTLATAWNSGNSNGTSHGGPNSGSLLCRRSMPSSWNISAVYAVWVWRNPWPSRRGRSRDGTRAATATASRTTTAAASSRVRRDGPRGAAGGTELSERRPGRVTRSRRSMRAPTRSSTAGE